MVHMLHSRVDRMGTKRLRRGVGQALEYLAAAHIDLRLWLTGKADRELPPLRMRFVGMGDFRAIGEELAALLARVGGLRRSEERRVGKECRSRGSADDYNKTSAPDS